MKIKFESKFKDVSAAQLWFESWVSRLEHVNRRSYTKLELSTSLGKTVVYALNLDSTASERLVIFPGARTSSLFWDLNRNLDLLKKDFKIFLVETNGLPNLSDGRSPDIHSLDYGWWASEVLNELSIEETYIAGASFGGLICAKLCLTSPSRVKASFLLNPGCLQPFSMRPSNLFYNLLPILFPSRKNIKTFLNEAIFYKPNHSVPDIYEELMIDYEQYALTQYIDRTQKPYDMRDELKGIKTDTYLILGEQDMLFPLKKSLKNASILIPGLKEVVILAKTGHGIETSGEAINCILKYTNKFKAV